jgi:hypothetical protein
MDKFSKIVVAANSCRFDAVIFDKLAAQDAKGTPLCVYQFNF